MKRITIIIMGAVITLLCFTRCGQKGCQDPNAINYCSECTKDGEACIFKSNVTFYYNLTTAENLLSEDIDTLFYFFNDELIGSAYAGKFYEEAPVFGDSQTVSGTV